MPKFPVFILTNDDDPRTCSLLCPFYDEHENYCSLFSVKVEYTIPAEDREENVDLKVIRERLDNCLDFGQFLKEPKEERKCGNCEHFYYDGDCDADDAPIGKCLRYPPIKNMVHKLKGKEKKRSLQFRYSQPYVEPELTVCGEWSVK